MRKPIFRVLLVEDDIAVEERLVRQLREWLPDRYDLRVNWKRTLHGGLVSLISSPPTSQAHLIIIPSDDRGTCASCGNEHTGMDIAKVVAIVGLGIPVLIRASRSISMMGAAEASFTVIGKGQDHRIEDVVVRRTEAIFDRPTCPACSEHLVRNGTTWKCLNDGYTTAVQEAVPVAHA